MSANLPAIKGGCVARRSHPAGGPGTQSTRGQETATPCPAPQVGDAELKLRAGAGVRAPDLAGSVMGAEYAKTMTSL